MGNEPGIDTYNPDGGNLGVPRDDGCVQEALESACRQMAQLGDDKKQPTKLCLELPIGFDIYQTLDGQVIFDIMDPKSFDINWMGVPSGQRAFYITYDPAKREKAECAMRLRKVEAVLRGLLMNLRV